MTDEVRSTVPALIISIKLKSSAARFLYMAFFQPVMRPHEGVNSCPFDPFFLWCLRSFFPFEGVISFDLLFLSFMTFSYTFPMRLHLCSTGFFILMFHDSFTFLLCQVSSEKELDH